MKNLSLILNAILIVAVAVLFYLHFSSDKTTPVRQVSDEGINILEPNTPIVYINIDSLLNNYTYFHDMQDEFADKQSELEAELNLRSRQYETSALDFQNKVQKGLVTRREAQELEQQLLQEQQGLLQLRDQLTMELAEEEQVRNRRLINKIMDFLAEYNKDFNYQFIFSNSFGDNVLFANDKLDITSSVLVGLNEQYNKEKDKQ
ncbi:MAG: OmpH family outer membrane protein [Bacteroidales bacterium]|nr:OmpH family outer membrane protein [Bacteroidales bacterium]